MPIPTVCPGCGRSGKLPDTFPGGKVKCPACGVVSQIPAPAPAPPAPRLAAPAPKAKPAPVLDALDEADDLPPPSPTTVRGRATAAPAGQNPLLYAILGVGGVISALLLVLLVVLLTRSGGREDRPAADAAPPAVAEATAAPATPNPAVELASNPPAGPAPPGLGTAPPGLAAASVAPAESREQTVQRIKEATVYIKVRAGKLGSTGTGFVIQASGNSALIATNRHVITPGDDDDDEEPAARGPAPTVTVVFRSGERPGVEQEVPATIIAVEAEPGPSRDLAVLSVQGVARLPRPIDPAARVQPVEGMPLKIYGFPFGGRINVASKGNPVTTVTSGTVSALQKDTSGGLALVQLDGSVHPGNSGGPVVDEQGHLVGVTVAKLRAADNIGLAVPAAHLGQLLDGRVGALELAAQAVQAGSADLRVKAAMADPLNRVRSVSLHVAPAGPGTSPVAAATPSLLPGALSVPLAVDPATRTASGQVRAALARGGRRILVQVSYVDSQGRTVVTAPVPYEVPTSPGRLAAVGDRARRLASFRKKSLGRLGPLTDPDKDCKEARTDKGITIDIPGKLHTLSPQLRDKKNRPVANAPTVLAPIDGDFLAHVRIAGEIRPGSEPCQGPSGRRIPFAIQGAGLLLWQDKDNFLRLERSCGTTGGLTLVNRLIVEVCKDGREAGQIYLDVPAGPLQVMLLRKDGHLRCLFSSDAKEGWTVFKELAVDFPSKVSVGLSAFNTAKKPFSARFEDFVLLDDSSKFDDELKPE
jgi:S1-C subfamily serine protease